MLTRVAPGGVTLWSLALMEEEAWFSSTFGPRPRKKGPLCEHNEHVGSATHGTAREAAAGAWQGEANLWE